MGQRVLGVALATATAIGGCSNGDTVPQSDDSSSGAGSLTGSISAGSSSSSGNANVDESGESTTPDVGVPIPPTCDDPIASGSLELLGAGEGVHVGDVPELGLSIFT